MQKHIIPLTETSLFDTLFLDYIHKKDQILPYYNLDHDIENYQRQINKRNDFSLEKRNILHDILLKQYHDIQNIPKNIDRLREKNTFTITTGHQLNLCTGPLFSIYKILKTIKLSDVLKQQYPQYNFVPIFWMLTEDHDLEEINHFNLFGRRYTWTQKNTQAMVGTYQTTGINELLETIKEIPSYFVEAYQKKNLTEATRFYLHHLFGRYGLVILDSNEPTLKEVFRPIIEKELFEQPSEPLVLKSIATLKNMGYKTVVKPRSFNLFYIHDNRRKRIIALQNNKLQLVDNSIIDLYEALDNIGNFSPNVVLRPVYQEYILPNLGYVGGPTEINYWLEYKSLFDWFKVSYPIIVPRTFGLILSKTLNKKFKNLNLKPKHLLLTKEELKKQYIASLQNISPNLDWIEDELKPLYEKIKNQIKIHDTQLLSFFMKRTNEITQIIKRLQKRLNQTIEQANTMEIEKINNFFDKLNPHNNLQERIENFLSFYINHPDFINNLHDQIDPFEEGYCIFTM